MALSNSAAESIRDGADEPGARQENFTQARNL